MINTTAAATADTTNANVLHGTICEHHGDAIQTEIWCHKLEADGTESPYITRLAGVPIGVVANALHKRIRRLVDEYFTVACGVNTQAEWPADVRWVACFPVTGGNEGHYVHVEVVLSDGSRKLLFLGKTFKGMAHAAKIAARCAVALGA